MLFVLFRMSSLRLFMLHINLFLNLFQIINRILHRWLTKLSLFCYLTLPPLLFKLTIFKIKWCLSFEPWWRSFILFSQWFLCFLKKIQFLSISFCKIVSHLSLSRIILKTFSWLSGFLRFYRTHHWRRFSRFPFLFRYFYLILRFFNRSLELFFFTCSPTQASLINDLFLRSSILLFEIIFSILTFDSSLIELRV